MTFPMDTVAASKKKDTYVIPALGNLNMEIFENEPFILYHLSSEEYS